VRLDPLWITLVFDIALETGTIAFAFVKIIQRSQVAIEVIRII